MIDDAQLAMQRISMWNMSKRDKLPQAPNLRGQLYSIWNSIQGWNVGINFLKPIILAIVHSIHVRSIPTFSNLHCSPSIWAILRPNRAPEWSSLKKDHRAGKERRATDGRAQSSSTVRSSGPVWRSSIPAMDRSKNQKLGLFEESGCRIIKVHSDAGRIGGRRCARTIGAAGIGKGSADARPPILILSLVWR